jgi:hypothetical protein
MIGPIGALGYQALKPHGADSAEEIKDINRPDRIILAQIVV